MKARCHQCGSTNVTPKLDVVEQRFNYVRYCAWLRCECGFDAPAVEYDPRETNSIESYNQMLARWNNIHSAARPHGWRGYWFDFKRLLKRNGF